MKKRAKIIATATVVAITFLMITAYHTEPMSSPSSHQNYPVSGVVEVSKSYTSPIKTKPLADEEMSKIGTQIEEFIEPPTEDSSIPQTTDNIEPTNTPTTLTQTATKPTTPTPKEPTTLQMGENQCIFVEDMFENGNKIGIMGQSDGDINKMVGTMD